jgi:hypothetical protein
MSWIHAYHDAGPRFDAAVASSIDAHHRSATAAQGLTGAAREARHRVEAAGRNIRERSDVERKKPLRTGDVRSLVEDMLESMEPERRDEKDRGPC